MSDPGLAASRPLAIALVGNPNTGKTTLFNALTGLKQRVGNFPGVTVSWRTGSLRLANREIELIDLPGTYSLAPRSPDEMVAVDLLLGHGSEAPPPDRILAIVDASNLERHLYLVSQLLELGRPVVVALNMTDRADQQGVRIDTAKLARQLNVPVVSIQANTGAGIDNLRRVLSEPAQTPRPPRLDFPDAYQAEIDRLRARLGPRVEPFLLARLLLDAEGSTESRFVSSEGPELRALLTQARERLQAAGHPLTSLEARVRYAWIRAVTAGCLHRPRERATTWTDRLDRVVTHRLWGSVAFLAIMFLMFQSIFIWARPLMKMIGAGKDFLANAVREGMPPGPLNSLLADGILEGAGAVVMFLPQILILFGFIAILEDCGYMARAAFLMDRVMARCGLSGKSFIPLLSSLACAVPGILATRVIEQRRDRLATILVAPLMSCSARLPVYILLIGACLTEGYPWWMPGLTMFALYALGLILAPLIALLLKRTLLRGDAPLFIMEMPPFKMPTPRTVIWRMGEAASEFLVRAGSIILASMVLVWALLYFPAHDAQGQSFPERIEAIGADAPEAHRLEAQWKRHSYLGRLGQAIEPIVHPLGWDWRIGVATLASFPAREVVVGTLGIILQQGKVDTDAIREADWSAIGSTDLGRALQTAAWENQPERKLFTVPTVLSVLVFFALCSQCASTLAVIGRETRSWGWPLFTFVYMTVLAYVAALIAYQGASALGL